jgi:hypothetical protein
MMDAAHTSLEEKGEENHRTTSPTYKLLQLQAGHLTACVPGNQGDVALRTNTKINLLYNYKTEQFDQVTRKDEDTTKFKARDTTSPRRSTAESPPEPGPEMPRPGQLDGEHIAEPLSYEYEDGQGFLLKDGSMRGICAVPYFAKWSTPEYPLSTSARTNHD